MYRAMVDEVDFLNPSRMSEECMKSCNFIRISYSNSFYRVKRKEIEPQEDGLKMISLDSSWFKFGNYDSGFHIEGVNFNFHDLFCILGN